MKKAIFILTIIFIFTMLNSSNYIIPKESIRFRIIPNSNNAKDIIMKEKVVYVLNDTLNKFNTSSIEATRNSINKSISTIERNIDVLFSDNNYDMDYDISYGFNEFPTKYYDGVEYSEGNYESLVIKIGDAKGDNFWCVLYPPLCMIEDEKKDIAYKFKILDIVNGIFK